MRKDVNLLMDHINSEKMIKLTPSIKQNNVVALKIINFVYTEIDAISSILPFQSKGRSAKVKMNIYSLI